MIKKVNELFYIKIDTNRDNYNIQDSFSGVFILDENNSETPLDVFEEIILNISPAYCTNDNEVKSGVKSFKITQSMSPLEKGDVINYGQDYYYIKDIVNDNIVLYTNVKNNIPQGSTISRVGNTGIYRSPLRINSSGEYTIIVKNNTNIQNHQYSIRVIPEDITDAHLKLDDILTDVDQLNDARNYVAFV